MLRVRAVIVNYQGAADTIECLNSLKAQSGVTCAPLVVDNASDDDSAALIRAAHPDVELIVTEKNLGFAGGNNVGIRHALKQPSFDYLFLVNNDTVMERDCLQQLTQCAQDQPMAAVITPAIYWYVDRNRPWFTGGETDMSTGDVLHSDLDVRATGLQDPFETPWVSGCAMLVPVAQMLEIGGFDERFFCYFEDVDWSFRARGFGYDCIICPTALMYHKNCATSIKSRYLTQYYSVRNHFLFLKKNAPLKKRQRLLRARARVVLQEVWKMVSRPAPFAGRRRACVHLVGMLDFFLGRFGRQHYSWF